MSAEHPTNTAGTGLVLSPAEADRLSAVFCSAGLTLRADDGCQPLGQRAARRILADRLDLAFSDLTRRLQRAQQASVRLDTPVRLDDAEGARVLDLLDQAASRLDELANQREHQPYLVGPGYFRQQANAARAWHADLGELAARQADRCQPTRDRAEPDRKDGHETP
jgi:hypothetical protein